MLAWCRRWSDDLPAAVEVAAYRIVLEALTNVIRHAGPCRCAVGLVVGDHLDIDVTDDGAGLAGDVLTRSGVGLRSMAERVDELNGTFAFGGVEGGGCRLRMVKKIRGDSQ